MIIRSSSPRAGPTSTHLQTRPVIRPQASTIPFIFLSHQPRPLLSHLLLCHPSGHFDLLYFLVLSSQVSTTNVVFIIVAAGKDIIEQGLFRSKLLFNRLPLALCQLLDVFLIFLVHDLVLVLPLSKVCVLVQELREGCSRVCWTTGQEGVQVGMSSDVIFPETTPTECRMRCVFLGDSSCCC